MDIDIRVGASRHHTHAVTQGLGELQDEAAKTKTFVALLPQPVHIQVVVRRAQPRSTLALALVIRLWTPLILME